MGGGGNGGWWGNGSPPAPSKLLPGRDSGRTFRTVASPSCRIPAEGTLAIIGSGSGTEQVSKSLY